MVKIRTASSRPTGSSNSRHAWVSLVSAFVAGLWLGWALGRESGVDDCLLVHSSNNSLKQQQLHSRQAAATISTKREHQENKSLVMMESPQLSSLEPPKSLSASSRVVRVTFETHSNVHSSNSNDEKKKNSNICNLGTDLEYFTSLQDYPPKRQDLYSRESMMTLQPNELLLLFGLVRSSSVRRILELGGLQQDGASSWNWLQALKCKQSRNSRARLKVYTIDVQPSVLRHSIHEIDHVLVMETAATVKREDIEHQAIDLLLVDARSSYHDAQTLLQTLVLSEPSLLSPDGFIVLHDTQVMSADKKRILLADWIMLQDCRFQRIGIHHDNGAYNPEQKYHEGGLTILQRRASQTFPKELCSEPDGSYLMNDCVEIQQFQQALLERESQPQCRRRKDSSIASTGF